VEWDVIEVPVYFNVYPAQDGGYLKYDMSYYFTFRRRTHWAISPQICLSLSLGLLSLIPCLLPHSRVLEKVMVQLVSLLGIFTVYWDIVAKLPPTTLVIPHLVKYLHSLAFFNFVHILLICLLSHCALGFGSGRCECVPQQVGYKVCAYGNHAGIDYLALIIKPRNSFVWIVE